MSRKTPLGAVLGLGSAKEGTDHWWVQRVTAVAVAVLGVWFALALVQLVAAGLTYEAVRDWMASPWRAAALIALVVAVAWHSMLGIQVIIEDYVHNAWFKVIALVGQKFAHIVLALAGTLAVLRVALGA